MYGLSGMRNKKFITLLLTLTLFFVITGCGGGGGSGSGTASYGVLITNQNNKSQVPIFPGAEGFGVATPAGRGGAVYKVSNLNPSGDGSLKACIDAKGPRVCVFEVSGYIELTDEMGIYEPYLTIAGQTAPSPGITIRGAGLIIFTHDVLIQHLRIRVGDNQQGPDPDNRDAIGLNAGFGEVYNVVIDHCSFSWATDEVVSAWYAGVHDITISNSIISEGLYHSIHPTGYHSTGLIIGPHGKNITIINNLFAHNSDRNPLIMGDSSTVIMNNVMYNTTAPLKYQGWIDDLHVSPVISNVIGNVIIPGYNAVSVSDSIIFQEGLSASSRIYLSDNYSPVKECNPGYIYAPWCIAVVIGIGPTRLTNKDQQVWISSLHPQPSNEVKGSVLSNAGARPADRDSVDIRIVNDVIQGTGQIIDCVSPGESVQNTGTVQNGSTSNTVVISPDSIAQTNLLEDYKIRVISLKGIPQIKTIISNDESTKVITLDSSLDFIPERGDRYTIFSDCSKNAGGWPNLKNDYRALTLPDDPNNDSDGDDYTDLEEWLHTYPR